MARTSHLLFKPVARSGKGGVRGKKKVDPKWAWVTKRGRVREGDVPPPALRAEAFEKIDLATQKN